MKSRPQEPKILKRPSTSNFAKLLIKQPYVKLERIFVPFNDTNKTTHNKKCVPGKEKEKNRDMEPKYNLKVPLDIELKNKQKEFEILINSMIKKFTSVNKLGETREENKDLKTKCSEWEQFAQNLPSTSKGYSASRYPLELMQIDEEDSDE